MHLLPRELHRIRDSQIREYEPCRSRRLQPSNPPICNCQALRQAARHVSQIYDDHLAAVGLKTSQYSILSKLNRLGPQSINELGRSSLVMDRTTLGRARCGCSSATSS